MVEFGINGQASEVAEETPSPVPQQKPRRSNRNRARNKDLEINPSLEPAIASFVLEKVQGVKSKNKNRRKKAKKPSDGVAEPKKLAIESVSQSILPRFKQNNGQVVLVEPNPGSYIACTVSDFIRR